MDNSIEIIKEAQKKGFPLPQGGWSKLKGIENRNRIIDYFKKNPQAMLYECSEELKLSQVTVIKHMKVIRKAASSNAD